MLVSRVICQTNWNTRVYVVFQSIISHGWQATGSQSPLLILLQCRQGNMGNRSYMRFCGGIQYSGFSNGVRYVLGWCCVGVAANKCVRCMQWWCCGFVFGRRGQFRRRSSIQVDEISCIRDHLN
jgi:hypothetical protein